MNCEVRDFAVGFIDAMAHYRSARQSRDRHRERTGGEAEVCAAGVTAKE
jgi:hypothetical protein